MPERVRAGRSVAAREVLRRGILYGVLAAFIAAVYVSVVVGAGSAFGTGGKPNTSLSIAATAIVAVAFRRVRERAERLANRFVYGERVTPFEALSRFSARVAATDTTEEVLGRMAHIIAEGTGAARADVWLRTGRELLPAASFPPSERAPVPFEANELPVIEGADRVIEVRHRGELLGALSIAKRAGEPVTAPEDKLLRDLASQAGLVLRNVGLTAELAVRLEEIAAQAFELRASRQRIVAAQDRERRRLERDIHDGAQQHLVALAVQLGMAKTLAAQDTGRAGTMITELRSVTADALETLRDLSRGIYPPMLTDLGLEAALRTQAAKAGPPVEVQAAGLGRHAPEIEAGVYFTCCEALQNSAKHGGGARAVVRLEETEGRLVFSVSDSGAGFDLGSIARGSGLENMKDRIAALGGRLEIRSSPGAGVTVAGSVPVGALDAAV